MDKDDMEYQKNLAKIQKLTPEQIANGLRLWFAENKSEPEYTLAKNKTEPPKK